MDAKTYLLEILEYYKHKLLNNGCTAEEINSVTKTIQQNMEINGTISDFAQFFGVPETTVRTNINRKMFSKPKRRVYYSIREFLKIVPDKWLKKK